PARCHARPRSPPRPPPLPYTTLFRSARLRHSGYESRDSEGLYAAEHLPIDVIISPEAEVAQSIARRLVTPGAFDIVPMAGGLVEDRKSTRLNSSHVKISYAVFCLRKK